MPQTGLPRGIQACTASTRLLQLLFLIALSMAVGGKKKEKSLAVPSVPRVQLKDLFRLLYESLTSRR